MVKVAAGEAVGGDRSGYGLFGYILHRGGELADLHRVRVADHGDQQTRREVSTANPMCTSACLCSLPSMNSTLSSGHVEQSFDRAEGDQVVDV